MRSTSNDVGAHRQPPTGSCLMFADLMQSRIKSRSQFRVCIHRTVKMNAKYHGERDAVSYTNVYAAARSCTRIKTKQQQQQQSQKTIKSKNKKKRLNAITVVHTALLCVRACVRSVGYFFGASAVACACTHAAFQIPRATADIYCAQMRGIYYKIDDKSREKKTNERTNGRGNIKDMNIEVT